MHFPFQLEGPAGPEEAGDPPRSSTWSLPMTRRHEQQLESLPAKIVVGQGLHAVRFCSDAWRTWPTGNMATITNFRVVQAIQIKCLIKLQTKLHVSNTYVFQAAARLPRLLLVTRLPALIFTHRGPLSSPYGRRDSSSYSGVAGKRCRPNSG